MNRVESPATAATRARSIALSIALTIALTAGTGGLVFQAWLRPGMVIDLLAMAALCS